MELIRSVATAILAVVLSCLLSGSALAQLGVESGHGRIDYGCWVRQSADAGSIFPNSCQPAAVTAPSPPRNMKVTSFGTTVALLWSTVSNATGYTLYYAPYPDASYVGEIAMGTATSVSGDLWPGAAFYVAVKAYNTAGSSGYSNIEHFTLPEEDKFRVTVYDPEKAYNGTTFLVYKYSSPDILYELDMRGDTVWSYELSEELGGDQTEAELLAGNTILILSPSVGLYEIDRQGNVLWSHTDTKVSHDADRLANGNTIYVYGMGDQKTDAVVKEVDAEGTLVWEWYAKDHFDYSLYSGIENQGWTHTNAVTRLDSGNTLISLRNFDMIAEVDQNGDVVDTIEDIVKSPHDPLVLDNGHILVAHQTTTYHAAVELDPESEQTVWEYGFNDDDDFPIRDVNLLPNDNILITGSRRIVEVTPDKEIVWQLELVDPEFGPGEKASKGFYKAERL
jgi:hypothetical protein